MRSLEDITIEKDRTTYLIQSLMEHLDYLEKEYEEKVMALERETLGLFIKGKYYKK